MRRGKWAASYREKLESDSRGKVSVHWFSKETEVFNGHTISFLVWKYPLLAPYTSLNCMSSFSELVFHFILIKFWRIDEVWGNWWPYDFHCHLLHLFETVLISGFLEALCSVKKREASTFCASPSPEEERRTVVSTPLGQCWRDFGKSLRLAETEWLGREACNSASTFRTANPTQPPMLYCKEL